MIPSRCTVQTPPGVPNSIDENRSSESKHQTTPLHTAIFPKGNLKFSDSKMRWKKKSEKFSLSQNFKLHLTFSGR